MKSDLNVLKKTEELFNYKTQFKFIISDKQDYEYAKNNFLYLSGSSPIIFQPEWSSRKFIKKLIESTKENCLNVRVILRQQKVIWG